MKTIKCADVVYRGCGFASIGKTDAEASKALMDHAKKDHKDLVAKMKESDITSKMNAVLAKQKSS